MMKEFKMIEMKNLLTKIFNKYCFIIFISSLFSSIVFAKTLQYFPYEEEYLASYPMKGVNIERTPLYTKGLETMYLSYYFKEEKGIDPYDITKKRSIKVPDYKKALTYFIKSFKEEKNLAAAYIATKIIDMGFKENNEAIYFEMIHFLAKQNNCKGMSKEGYFFYYGFGGVIEDKKAGLKKLQNALDICVNTPYNDSIMRMLFEISQESKK